MTQTLCLIIAGLICLVVVGASWHLDRRERRRLRARRRRSPTQPHRSMQANTHRP